MEGKTADPPVEVVLLVDRVNATVQNSSSVREQVKKYMGQNGGQLALPASLIFFADTGTPACRRLPAAMATLFFDVDQSESGVRSVTRSQGVYGAIDRFQMSLRTLVSVAGVEEKNRAERCSSG